MSFQANEEHYKQVLELLVQASNPSAEVIRQVWEQFMTHSKRPDFNCYLAHAMKDRSLSTEVRQWAAIVLKNGIAANIEAIVPHLDFIQDGLLSCIGDPAKEIRNAVANSVSVLSALNIDRNGESSTAQLLRLLCVSLQSADVPTAQGAAKALHNICEDQTEIIFATNLAEAIFSPLLTHAKHNDAVVRENCYWGVVNLCTSAHALEISGYIPKIPQYVTNHVGGVIEAGMLLAQDGANTQVAVCRAFAFIAETHLDRLEPMLEQVFQYLISVQNANRGKNDNLSLEACDFWTAVVDKMFDKPLFRALLPQLVASLMDCMRYSEIELSMILSSDDDVSRPDRDQDVKPSFLNQKAQKKTGAGEDAGDSSDDDEEEEEEEDDEDYAEGEWNLRRSAASTLDALATCYHHEAAFFLSVVVPELEKRTQPSQPWEVREAALLALGTTAQGMGQAWADTLPSFTQMFVTYAQDAHFLVRTITAWVLGKFVPVADEHPDQSLLQAGFSTLTALLGDRSKKVVASACRALGRDGMLETIQLTPECCKHVLTAAGQALNACDTVNLKELLYVLHSVCESVGSNLDTPEFIELLMTPLVAKWERYANNDVRICPVLQTMGAAATALGPSFQRWGEGVFRRATEILAAAQEYRAQNDFRTDSEYAVACLSCHSGLLDGLESSMEPLWGASPGLVQVLIQCLSDKVVKVRQSAFALLGDAVKWCWPHVAPGVSQYLPLLEASCQLEHPLLCINVLYALGEMIMKVGANFKSIPGDVPNMV